MSAALPLESSLPAAWLAKGLKRGGAEEEKRRREEVEKKTLTLEWPELERLLPDGGLPWGVTELSSPHAVGGATTIALAALHSAQKKDPFAWGAWLDPEGTLNAPGVEREGVDLGRLFVVRPPREDLGRIAVKVAASRAFTVIVADMDPVWGVATTNPSGNSRDPLRGRVRRPIPPEVLVRKLAILAEAGGASILLITDSTKRRPSPWPVMLRLELARRADAFAVRVAKDHRARIALTPTWISSIREGVQHPSLTSPGLRREGV